MSNVCLKFPYRIEKTADGYAACCKQFNRFGLGKTVEEAVKELEKDLAEYLKFLYNERIYFTGGGYVKSYEEKKERIC